MTRLRIPTWATIALSVLAGVLSVLNITSFGFVAPWQNLVAVGLAALAALGIAPLTGPSLQTALHISHALALSLASLVSTAVVAVTTLSIDQTAKGIIAGVLTLLAGVLFGPAGGAAPAPAPASVPTSPVAS